MKGDGRTALYRFFDSAGTLLYVGQTRDPGRRLAQHGGEKSWWERVANVTIEWCDDRAAALEAEKTAIREERPLFNIQHAQSQRLAEAFEMRTTLMSWWGSAKGREMHQEFIESDEEQFRHAGTDPDGVERTVVCNGADRRHNRCLCQRCMQAIYRDSFPEVPSIGDFRSGLMTGDFYWVNRDMAELTLASASMYPEDVPLRRDEVPSDEGLVIFDTPLDLPMLHVEDDDDGLSARLNHSFPPTALTWRIDRINEFGDGLVVMGWYGRDAWASYYDSMSCDSRFDDWGIPVVPYREFGSAFDEGVCLSSKPTIALRALWALTRQRLTTASTARASRAAARRAARIGLPPDMQVVTLRRSAAAVRERSGPARDVHWSHRWLVGAHWRNQWMPSTGTHELRWIAPYVKGPDDQPLVVARAYQVVR